MKTEARDNTEEAEPMAIEAEEWRRERRRLLYEAMAAGGPLVLHLQGQ